MDLPILFLYFRDGLPVVASRIHGIVPAPSGINYNFHRVVRAELIATQPVRSGTAR